MTTNPTDRDIAELILASELVCSFAADDDAAWQVEHDGAAWALGYAQAYLGDLAAELPEVLGLVWDAHHRIVDVAASTPEDEQAQHDTERRRLVARALRSCANAAPELPVPELGEVVDDDPWRQRYDDAARMARQHLGDAVDWLERALVAEQDADRADDDAGVDDAQGRAERARHRATLALQLAGVEAQLARGAGAGAAGTIVDMT